MFEQDFLDEIRQELEAQKKELVRRQKETSSEILEIRDSDAGILDSIDTTMLEQTTSTMLKLKERELEKLRAINAALARLDKGEYGYCVETGEPIAGARLRANPLARLTLEAQKDLEEEERRRNFRPGLLDDME